MRTLINLVNKNGFFYAVSLVFIVAAILFMSFLNKAECFILLNSFHSDEASKIFKMVTFFGDGLFVFLLIALVFLVFKKHKKLAFLLLIAYVLSGAFSQLLKNSITAPRPIEYFHTLNSNFDIDTFKTCGVGFSSFPSGHTTTAFALATIFAFYFRNRLVSSTVLFLAMAVGYSRIYLANHFLLDVLVGAIIGIFFGSISVFVFKRITAFVLKQKNRENTIWINSFPNSSAPNT